MITKTIAGFANAKGGPMLYERLPNSTRAVPADDIEAFLADRFGRAG